MKRWLFKLVLFLILGAIVNVAVAWGCAVWSDVIWPSKYTEWLEIDWFSRVSSDDLKAELRSRFLVLQTSDKDFEITTSTHSGFGLKYNSAWVYTVLNRSQDFRGKHYFFHLSIYSEGWPLKAFSCEHFNSSEQSKPNGILSGGFNPPPLLTRGTCGYAISFDIKRLLAFHPIWPGFAINTILYSVLLWLLTVGPFTARRMIRRKRGLCIKCGYDLRGTKHDVCPECGKELCKEAKQ